MVANIVFLECRCREAVIRERLHKRSRSPAISDARLKHLEEFKLRYEALDDIPADIKIPVDTENPLADSVEKILSNQFIRPENGPFGGEVDGF